MELIGREIRVFVCKECGRVFKLEYSDIIKKDEKGYTNKYIQCVACGKEQRIDHENCKFVIEYGDEHDTHYLNMY